MSMVEIFLVLSVIAYLITYFVSHEGHRTITIYVYIFDKANNCRVDMKLQRRKQPWKFIHDTELIIEDTVTKLPNIIPPDAVILSIRFRDNSKQ